MSDWVLVLLVAAITYLSRAAAVALLPAASGPLLEFINRLPAPLFAGLAMFALVGEGSAMPEPATLAAAGGALLAAPRRSLSLTLAVGLAAYGLVTWLT